MKAETLRAAAHAASEPINHQFSFERKAILLDLQREALDGAKEIERLEALLREQGKIETIDAMKTRHEAERIAMTQQVASMGLTQRAASKMLGINQQALSQYCQRKGIVWGGRVAAE